jgi:hypothetical protein
MPRRRRRRSTRSAALKVVPAVGHPAAAPFDACADAID